MVNDAPGNAIMMSSRHEDKWYQSRTYPRECTQNEPRDFLSHKSKGNSENTQDKVTADKDRFFVGQTRVRVGIISRVVVSRTACVNVTQASALKVRC
jgi:hypothetical protein